MKKLEIELVGYDRTGSFVSRVNQRVDTEDEIAGVLRVYRAWNPTAVRVVVDVAIPYTYQPDADEAALLAIERDCSDLPDWKLKEMDHERPLLNASGNVQVRHNCDLETAVRLIEQDEFA